MMFRKRVIQIAMFAAAAVFCVQPCGAAAVKPAPEVEVSPGYVPVPLDALKISWADAETVRPGVQVLRLDSQGPWETPALHAGPRRMKIVLMRVALAGLSFAGTPRDPDWGKPMPDEPKNIIRTLRMRTADFMRLQRRPVSEGGMGREMVVASNTAPWSPWKPPYTQKYGNPTGIEISDGVVVCDNRNHYKALFIVWKDGRMEIAPELPRERYGEVHLAHSGFGILLKDGEEVPDGGYEKAIMPRMAAGFSPERQYLYLLTIDGRQPGWSDGAYGSDMRKIFRAAGASDAIDFDGGGSATLCYWDEARQKPVMVNRHGKSGYARPCGMNWGLYKGGPKR